MKAMLYADWRSVRRSVKAILWVVLVMSVAASAFGGVMVVPFMLTMLSLMFPATLMNTDHAYGWDKLSLTLPVSRRDVVGSKFTVSLLVNLAAFALSTVLILIFTAVNRDSSLAENLFSLIACEAAGLLLMGVQFVLILKFGTERGRYLLMGVVWVPIILINVLKNHPAANSLVKAVGGMDSWPVTRLAGFAAGILLLCAAVLGLAMRALATPLTQLWGNFLSAPERQIAAADSAGEWCLQLLALAVLPAALEEALFRGVVLQTLLDSGSRFGAWLLTTLFFSLLHGNLAALPAHLLFGGALTLAEMRTGNLLVPMVMHAVYNASALFWRGMSAGWLIFCGAAVLALGIWALMTLPRTAKMRMKRGHIMLSAAILLLMAVQYLLG